MVNRTEDRRFEGESYTHDQLLVGNLFKVIFGTETTLFAWDSVNERFGWRGGVDAKGKGREGRLIGCSIGDTQLFVLSLIALSRADLRLQARRAISRTRQRIRPTRNDRQGSHGNNINIKSLDKRLPFRRRRPSILPRLRPSRTLPPHYAQ